MFREEVLRGTNFIKKGWVIDKYCEDQKEYTKENWKYSSLSEYIVHLNHITFI